MTIHLAIGDIKAAMASYPDAPFIGMARLVAQELVDKYPPATVAEPAEPPRAWDVMLDLETWGKRPGCALRSIGAVCFDPRNHNIGPEFYTNVGGGQVGAGLTVDGETAEWWQKQSEESQRVLQVDRKDLALATQSFREWFHAVNGVNVWSHGKAFDPPILEVASHAVGVQVPWGYRAVRDTRTLYDLAEFDPATIPNQGIKHHALHDARYQAVCVQAAMAKLHSPWGPIRGRHLVG